MSLINDALKKAQKQRTGDAPPLASMPAIGGESAGQISRRSKPASSNALLLKLGAGAAGLALVSTVAFLILRKPAAPAIAPASAAPAHAAVNPPLPTVSADTPAATPAKPTPDTFVLPIAAPPVAAPTPAPIATTPEIQPEVAAATPAPTPVAEKPQPAPASPPAVPGRLEPRAMTYIDNIHVAGIRASATDSKVLMNDRVYRLGDVVDHEMGLRLVGITANSLTFQDAAGGRYTRNF